MRKLNEDIGITDPALMQQYSNGQKQLLDKETQITALKKQIADIQASKIPIQKAMAEIEQKAGVQQQQQEVQQQEQIAQQQGEQEGAANESILIKVNESEDEEERIQLEIDQISDQMMLMEDPVEIEEMQNYLKTLVDRLKQLEMDQMDWEQQLENDPYMGDYESYDEFEDEEGYHEPGELDEDEEVRYSGMGSYDYTDKRNWYQKPENRVQEPAPPKERKKREKRMTKREYERVLKDIVSSLKGDDMEIDHSIMWDMAENQVLSNPLLKDYVIRRWQKEKKYDMPFLSPESIGEPSNNDIIELVTNDLEMSESYNPMSVENFYDMSEAYVEHTAKKNQEEYINKDYVFYVKINDEGNEFIGKIYKVRPDGDWFGQVASGDSDTFAKISYEPEYDEIDIVEFLGENYDKVEIIDMHEYNEFIEGDEMEESWPTNSIASS